MIMKGMIRYNDLCKMSCARDTSTLGTRKEVNNFAVPGISDKQSTLLCLSVDIVNRYPPPTPVRKSD